MHETGDGESPVAKWLREPNPDRTIPEVARDLRLFLDDLRAEQDRRRAAGDEDGAAALAPLVLNLMPAVDSGEDVAVTFAMQEMARIHGTGPYPFADIVALTGYSAPAVRRALADMIAAGLVTAPPDG